MRPSGAHTHPPRPGAVLAVLAAGAAAYAALSGRAGPAAHKAGHVAGELLNVVLWTAVALAGVAAVAAVVVLAVVTRRWREPRQVERGWTATVTGQVPPSVARLEPPPSSRALTRMPPTAAESRRLAGEPARDISAAADPPMRDLPAAPPQVHYHVHVHGDADPDAIAQALGRDAHT